MKATEMDLTTGNLFKKTFLFALPLMMTTIFQLLYTTIDLWTVSQFGGGSLSMSAIGSNGALINLILTVLINIASGSNVCISVAKGANDKEKAERVLHTSFLIAVVGGVVFGILGYFVSPSLLSLLGTPESIIGNATIYLRIYFIGTPLLMIYNFGANMLRALGDSRRPFYILMISGIINVIFDLIFVIFFDMDVAGVAIATVISELVSSTLVILWFMFYKKSFVKFSFKKLKFYKTELSEILKIGVPAGLQGLAFCIPNVLIQSSLYTIDNYYINGIPITQDEIVSGASASAQIEGYIFAMIDAFALSIVSLAGQNYGARNIKNIKKSFWYSTIWMLIFSAASLIIVLVVPYQLLGIFIKDNGDINVNSALLAGKERLVLMAATYFLDGLMDICGCYLRGLKRSGIPAITTIIGCTGSRILFLLTLFKTPYFHTISWLYAAFPISWILVNIAYIFIVPAVEKKQFKLIQEPSQQS